jgi:hypothetical protein
LLATALGGNVTLNNSQLTANTALAGAGGNGGSGGSGGAGGAASGGGIYSSGTTVFAFVDGQFVLVPTPATLTVSNASFIGNLAQGGAGGAGDGAGSGGAGGQGAGGVLFNDSDSTSNISGSLLTLNEAAGGSGGAGGSAGVGGSGGNGFGGGAYNNGPNNNPFEPLPGATLDLTDDLIVGNLAIGGKSGRGTTNGTAGQGVGGGLYLVTQSTASLTQTLVILNVASTSDPNIFGTVS